MKSTTREHVTLSAAGRKARPAWRSLFNCSGGALIELALLMPIMSAALIGAAEFARLAYAAIEVSNAAHAGVSFGAQNHITAQNLSGMEAAALDDGPNVTSLHATASTFCTCTNGTTVTCADAEADCTARILEYVQVSTTASVNPLFHVPGLPSTYTLNGLAVMRVEQ